MQKVSKDFPAVLRQRPISLELVKEKGLTGEDGQSLDYFSLTTQEPSKLLYRLNNCWLLSDLCKDLFIHTLNSSYESTFGTCHNKLRLILDLASLSHKLSFVFVSDGTLAETLK